MTEQIANLREASSTLAASSIVPSSGDRGGVSKTLQQRVRILHGTQLNARS